MRRLEMGREDSDEETTRKLLDPAYRALGLQMMSGREGLIKAVDRLRASRPTTENQAKGFPSLFMFLNLDVSVGRVFGDLAGNLVNWSEELYYTGSALNATPLSSAAARGKLTWAEFLLEQGADPNRGNPRPLCAAVDSGHLPVAALLLDHGADINLASQSGRTPLMAAVSQANPDLVSLLIDRGVSVDASLIGDLTLAIWCIARRKLKYAEMLIEAGASLNPGGHPISTEILASSILTEAERTSLLVVVHRRLHADGRPPSALYAHWPLVKGEESLLLEVLSWGTELPPYSRDWRITNKALELLFQAGADPRELLMDILEAGDPMPALVAVSFYAQVGFDFRQIGGLLGMVGAMYGVNSEVHRAVEVVMGESGGGSYEPSTVAHFCSRCRKTPDELFICAGCCFTAYCGRECQKAHRRDHRKICSQSWRARAEQERARAERERAEQEET